MSSENFRGATFMVLSMAFFAVEDMFIKLLSVELPVAQILATLGFLGFLSFAAILKIRGGRFWSRHLMRPIVLLRNLGEILGSVGVVFALALSDLSSVAAILQALPLAIALGAAVFLGEPVGWRRWTAISAGFFGVLMIIRPGFAGFEPASLAALMGVFGLALRDVATRRIPRYIHSDQLSASAFGALVLAALVVGPIMGQPLVPPDLNHILLFAGTLIAGVGGYALLVTATRIAEASSVAPYRYSRLLFALIIAFVVFQERPDTLTLTGAAIIMLSGGYTMWREAGLRRRKLREAGIIAPGD